MIGRLFPRTVRVSKARLMNRIGEPTIKEDCSTYLRRRREKFYDVSNAVLVDASSRTYESRKYAEVRISV